MRNSMMPTAAIRNVSFPDKKEPQEAYDRHGAASKEKGRAGDPSFRREEARRAGCA